MDGSERYRRDPELRRAHERTAERKRAKRRARLKRLGIAGGSTEGRTSDG